MQPEYRYYLIKGGKVMKAVKEYQARYEGMDLIRKGFGEHYGAIATWARPDRVYGYMFPAQPPVGWKMIAGLPKGVCIPDRSTQEGMEIYKVMRGLPQLPDPEFFAVRCGLDPYAENGNLAWPSFEYVGRTPVLMVPENDQQELQGIIEELCKSKYWAMKEAEAA